MVEKFLKDKLKKECKEVTEKYKAGKMSDAEFQKYVKDYEYFKNKLNTLSSDWEKRYAERVAAKAKLIKNKEKRQKIIEKRAILKEKRKNLRVAIKQLPKKIAEKIKTLHTQKKAEREKLKQERKEKREKAMQEKRERIISKSLPEEIL